MTPSADMSIAILVAQHPAINHAGILGEIRELRKHLDVRTASVRGPDRRAEELSDAEREEVAATFYVKPQGLAGAIEALLGTLFTRPLSLLRGVVYALKLGGPNIAQSLRNLAYLAEALMLGRWMRRQNLTHLHVHYSSTVGLFAARVFPIELSISFHGPDEFRDLAGFWLREKIEACRFVRAISEYARAQLQRAARRSSGKKSKLSTWASIPAYSAAERFRSTSIRSKSFPSAAWCR